jgi:hypothetical protein
MNNMSTHGNSAMTSIDSAKMEALKSHQYPRLQRREGIVLNHSSTPRLIPMLTSPSNLLRRTTLQLYQPSQLPQIHTLAPPRSLFLDQNAARQVESPSQSQMMTQHQFELIQSAPYIVSRPARPRVHSTVTQHHFHVSIDLVLIVPIVPAVTSIAASAITPAFQTPQKQ